MADQRREGVAAVVWRDGRYLLGHRAGTHEPGTWGLPGGKLDPGETHFACAVRELAEETGLVGRAVRALDYVDATFGGGDWRTWYVLVEAAGDPAVLEPTKHAEWRWVDPANLPAPLFAPLAAYLARTPLEDPRRTTMEGGS